MRTVKILMVRQYIISCFHYHFKLSGNDTTYTEINAAIKHYCLTASKSMMAIAFDSSSFFAWYLSMSVLFEIKHISIM